jgi:hypothetical protein
MLKLSLKALLLISLLSLPDAVFPQNSAPPTKLALEITYYAGRKPAYQSVPGPDSKPSGGWFGMFGRTPSSPAAASNTYVRAVGILSRVEGDGVRVYVSTLSGEKALEIEHEVGKYLLREGEKITVDELKQHGVEPFAIKLIRVMPTIAPVPPVFLKGVESLLVVSTEANESTLPSYKITVMNQSIKNILAVRVDIVTGEKIQITGRPQGLEGEPLIASGKTHQLTVRGPSRAESTVGGFVPTSPTNQEIQIKAVVFDDGTYEGDALTAAAVRGYRAGEKMVLPRLITSLEKALEALNGPGSSTGVTNQRNQTETALNVVDALRDLESQVTQISSDADPSIVERLTADFSQFDQPLRAIKQSFEFSATTIKTNLLKEIRKLQSQDSSSLDATSYRAWLSQTKDRYAKWLARL